MTPGLKYTGSCPGNADSEIASHAIMSGTKIGEPQHWPMPKAWTEESLLFTESTSQISGQFADL